MATIELRMPEDQQEGTVATIAAWLKKPGDAVKIHEPLVELDTDKVSMEIPAPASGVLKEILKREGEQAEPGELLGHITTEAETTTAEPQTLPPPAGAEKATTRKAVPNAARLLSPAVRRLVKEHHLDPATIKGTGRGGRITRKDVLRYLETKPKAEPVPAKTAEAAPPPGVIPSHRLPHTPIRRKIADHMVTSLLKVAPHVTSVFEMDLSAIIAHRRGHAPEFERRGVKLTFTAYFVSAAVEALRAVPEVNSRYHEDALEVFEDLNIGVGTALEDKGLIVPVIHRAQALNLFGVAARLQDLTARARNGTLSPADVRNGTFTISNHGVSGSLLAAPIIINQPQAAILGIGKLQKRVVVVERDGEDAILVKPMAYVTLSIDHRALDAYQTNNFLAQFVQAIETWK